MMINEFEKLTGIYPTPDLYEQIERLYYEYDGSKQEFCKAYKANKNGIAEIAAKRAMKATMEEKAAKDSEILQLEKTIKLLQEDLNREQEWKPYTDRHMVSQEKYDSLKASGRVMTDYEAIDWIAQEFGFDQSKIKILHTVPVYEINRHTQLRKVGEVERLPMYDATDWNYARFDVAGRSYEMYNDEYNMV